MRKTKIVPIITFALAVLLVSNNTSQIPASYEMGAIGLALEAYLGAVLIFSASLFILMLLKKIIEDKHIYIFLIIVFSIALFSIHYTSWRICVYQDPLLTERNRVVFGSVNDNKKLVEKMIKEGEVFMPTKNEFIVVKQSIYNTLKKLLDQPYKLRIKDSLNSEIYFQVFNWRSYDEDSASTNLYNSSRSKSLRIDTILFSPDFKKIIVFASFTSHYIVYKGTPNTISPSDILDSNSYSITLLGIVKGNKLLLGNKEMDYPAYGFSNQESAYYQTFIHNNESYTFTKKEFWDRGFFELKKIDDKQYYVFEIYYDKVIRPLLEINITK